ncbi:hypothetical protein HN51_036522 [Arachis hypogaea]|uniref:RING-type E3 ubiquitin transferase n=1 Tax=Arachis hypogaea TaxID=3818 RepID=A0A444ZZL9_ARAHY|nr:RING-H2 finger protein ATL22 isoform X1 [Arachis hypogaea]QHO01898.1 RING-H2 finger protein [Arachis hypogaea]RYR19623.1 hypothetical protein Ahy_B03g064468 [Arachis hypogaea]
MASSVLVAQLCLLVAFVFHNLQITRSKQVCDVKSCGEIEDIQFPFGLKEANQEPQCSYYPDPSFHLSCKRNNLTQTILTLPKTEDLVIKSIDYEEQTIQVNDPKGCLPKRFLHNNWDLSDSPFTLDIARYKYFNLTFLSCPSNWTKSTGSPRIACLSDNTGNSVIVLGLRPIDTSSTCDVISTALVPLPMVDMPQWPFWPDLNHDIGLAWTQPRCSQCAVSGQRCGFVNDKTSRVGCFSTPTKNQGLSSSAKYGLTLGVGVPGLLCLIGLSCFICGKVKVHIHRRQPIREFPTISLQPITLAMGLDRTTIEKYPKTLIGESGRLLKPTDNTCSICLCEYEPKDTLRTIPECNHYFHAECIDEWLRMNGTCPLCRNTPGALSRVNPSFSSLSHHTSSMSSTP